MNNTNKKEVLLLSPFFYPEQISTGKYNTSLVESLVENGCNVSIITSHPLYPTWIASESLEILKGTKIYRGGLNIRYPASPVLRRLVLEIWFSWHTLITFLKMRKKFYCVIPIFPPSLFFILLTKIISNKTKRVGIVHDLQGVHITSSSNYFKKIINKAIHFIEKKSFESCDRLIFLSNSMAKKAINDYKLDSESCVVCYPFTTTILEEPNTYDSLAHLFPKNKINVVYSGALGEKQNPSALLAFMNELVSTNSEICCHIFSGGPMFENIKNNQSGLHDTKIFFHNLVPIEHLNELYTRSDVQIIPQAFGTSDGSLPSKLPNLLSAGISIFAICEHGSELGDLVQASGAGHVANTWNHAELVKEFYVFLDVSRLQSPTTRKSLVQDFITHNFTIQKLITEIVDSKKENYDMSHQAKII